MKISFTKRTIDAARPRKGRDVFLWDAKQRGLGLRISRGGVKSFVFQYRKQGRRSPARLTLGRWGEMTLSAARQEAARLQLRVLAGDDPHPEAVTAREPTVEDLARRYMDEHARPKKKTSSARHDADLWRNKVLPVLGAMKLQEVTTRDITALHHRLRATPYSANRVLALLSKAFHLAERWGWIARGGNPVVGVDRYKEERRERLLSRGELARLAEALEASLAAGEVTPWGVAAVRLLLLTGCRKNEILRLRWREVDLERRVLRLKDSKTGRKLVPLSTPAAEVLAGLPRQEGNPHVIAGKRPGSHLVGLQKMWERVRQRAGLPDLRLHDLRHHFASLGAASGLTMPLLGAMLGHRSPATTERYIHWHNDPLISAADRVAVQIAAALEESAGSRE